MRLRASFVFLLCLLLACTKKAKTDSIEAGSLAPPDAAATAASFEMLPVGHWESRDVAGSKLCLTLMGHGFYRITATVPHYRNDARVSGRVLEARPGKTPRSFDITLGIRSIVAKEIGRCRKNWVDYRLPAAEVLGVRVTPTDGPEMHLRDDPWTFNDDAAATLEPPKRFSIQFDEAFENVEMCAAADQARDAETPRCRTMKKATSPSTKTFSGYTYGCKADTDCDKTYEGEMCAPCKCMNVAYYRGDPGSEHNKHVGDWLAAARDAEQGCHLPIPTPPDCPKCVDTITRCIDHRCKLVEKEAADVSTGGMRAPAE